MKFTQKFIHADYGFKDDFSVIMVGELTEPKEESDKLTVNLKIIDSYVLKSVNLSKLERMKRFKEAIENFRIKHNIPNEFISTIQTR